MGRGVAKLSRRTTKLIYSMPLHRLANLCIALAKRFFALPLLSASPQVRCCSSRRFAVALLHFSLLFRRNALAALLHRCSSQHRIALPWPIFALHGLAVALLNDSRPFRSTSMRFRCVSLLRYAAACLHTAVLFRGKSPPGQAFRCVTLPRVAIPLRYWISSQTNRPFPLLRHWPMPEKRP